MSRDRSFNYWGILVGGFFFVGVDFAVVFGVEGAVVGVEVLWGHGEDEAVFFAFEAGSVVATVGITMRLVKEPEWTSSARDVAKCEYCFWKRCWARMTTRM